MLVKVPIYVEFESLYPEEIPFIVVKLNEVFTKSLRREKFQKLTFKDHENEVFEIDTFTLKTRKQATDTLIKGKI